MSFAGTVLAVFLASMQERGGNWLLLRHNQPRQQLGSQQAIERTEGSCGGNVGDLVHGVSRAREGWSWTGVRLSHRRSACQWMPVITCAVISG